MPSTEAPFRDILQVQTTSALDLRDSLAARWIARPGGVTEADFKDPLNGFPTEIILDTLTGKIGDLDAIDMAIVSRTLLSMQRNRQIPRAFVQQCSGIVSQIQMRRQAERGKMFLIKPAKPG